MGSHEGPSGMLPNGLLQNVAEKVTRELDMERWSRAEERTAELIACIQPNHPSQARRKAVVDYVRRLVMNCISCQVFTFGSVPLKTYLPDGDIDLTAFSENENLRDNWAQEVRDKLEIEENSANAEFQVKGVQFIQAEVKIIKCLIENIVVDISFNQLGGLCTLCFLDEIDHLINHDHLFKRSVILIKAWCYYESRILGAHHGLISTYALETLVLYIFHVFNNCFAGPLEVLYRFLEFFSNFDWDNFCISLSGPVRISSLPDITAEPPRNDNGQLLLNKIFLDACSSVYAVFPPENQNQPFVSKHFNVIDPLRTNNNLGRSVSKGNFYRIRSAFAFGARRLARVLECPNENLIAEINQFFVNTWERHGNGVRPDAPLPDLWPPYPVSEQESRLQVGIKKKGESILSASQAEKSVIFNGTLFQPPEDIRHYNEYLPIITTPRAISQGQSHNIHTKKKNLCGYNQAAISNDALQVENSTVLSSGHVSGEHERFRAISHGQSHNIHTKEKNSCGYDQAAFSNDALQVENSTMLSSGHVSGEHERFSWHLFVRTRSSPWLIDQSVEDFPWGKQNGFLDSGKNHYFSTNGRGKSFVNADVSTASHRSRSSHIPVPLSSSVLASMGYGQRNLAGIAPANGPLVDSPRLSNGRTFPRNVSPSPVLHYISTVGMASKSEETLESGDDNSGLVNFNGEDSDGSWLDQDDCPRRRVNYENGNIQMTQPYEEQAPAAMAYISLSGNSFSDYYMREKHNFFEESKGQIGEDSVDSLPPLSSQGNDNYLSDQKSNMRYMPESQTGTSRSKPGSESSWDGSSARSSKSRRDKRGRKIGTSSAPSINGELKGSWHHERPLSDRASSHVDDNRDWVPLSTVDADMVEKISDPASIWPLYLQNQQFAVYNNTQMSGLDSAMPVAPVLVNSSSSQRSMDNSGIVPITFYPTIFFPVYDFPAETVNSESLTGHSDIDDAIDSSSHVNQTTEDTDAAESLNQSEMCASSSAKCFSDKQIEERSKRDILNGDFADHWLNLQYGRFCQHNWHRDSIVYTSSGTFPQMYSPWEGPGRPISSANVDLFDRMGYGPHLVPVSLQPGSCQPPAGLYEYQRHRDEVPKCRSGTGTYLPNPVSYRERESSHSRGQRGIYDHQKSERGESEINWNVGSKTRLCGYIQGSNQTEKQNSRPDRLGASETRKNRQRVPHKPEGQNKSFSSSNSVHANSTYGLHGYSSVNSNVVASPGPTVPPVVMFYPYDSNVGGCSSPPNQLKFGSFGPATFPRENEAPQHVVDPIKAGCAKRHDTYPAGSSSACSSPDKPSTLHLLRSAASRNILAER